MRLESPNSDQLTLKQVDSNNRIHLIITIILDHSPCTATIVRCMEKQSHTLANRVGLQFTTADQIKVRLERLLPPKPCRPAFNGFD